MFAFAVLVSKVVYVHYIMYIISTAAMFDQEISQMAVSATVEEEWAEYKRVWGKQYLGLEESRR